MSKTVVAEKGSDGNLHAICPTCQTKNVLEPIPPDRFLNPDGSARVLNSCEHYRAIFGRSVRFESLLPSRSLI